jgi:hypothetical protein
LFYDIIAEQLDFLLRRFLPYMTSFTLRLFALLLILFGGFQSIFAQELNAVVVRGNGLSTNPTDEDDSVVTGATVRGRVVYEDTNRPVR